MEFLPTLLNPLDDQKPSLFELLSEQQLGALIPPSVRYVLAVATHRYPRYLLRVLNNYDELYAILSLVVEKYYLETFGGGFTENFYGLKREKVLRLRGGELPRTNLGVPAEVRERLQLRNNRSDVWKNLAVMVGLPYLKRKLDESYDIHIAPSASLSAGLGGVEGRRFLDRDRLPPNATIKQRIMWAYKWFLRHIYPSVNAAYYFSILAFSLGYLFDGTKYSSPFLWMIGTRLRRMNAADHRAIEEAGKVSLAAAAGAPGRPGQGLAGFFHPRTLWPRLLSSLKLLLPASIFGLKFLEWWYQSDFSRQLTRKAAEGLELPPPIVSGQGLVKKHRNDREKLRKQREQGAVTPNKGVKREPPISSTSYLPILTVPPPASSDLCPICLHPIETAAACQTGYVFDFKCIFQWVDGTHERQEAWMKGEKMSEWEEEEQDEEESAEKPKSREGQWESGQGRCAVTGRRVLGGTSGIRRVMV
ncbi:ubiquitin-protein ligase peroxin 12 [Neophaeococcomyces mojaviensis]|uniref:Ubiquitin-protein ligase peroxin 12 n=1 Tax=Neophaeococcomyces mojaviensis TaxID=3383035 RepID=A0ACC3AA14_9EURO|nr:ubiquitin-protein ligase peroxin 12 [Knufia sp. JES_112]